MSALFLAAVLTSQAGGFDSQMAAFEAAKGKGDWARAESHLKQALAVKQTDYAAHSLAWVYGRQNRLEEAFSLSQQVVQRFGPTPIALMGLSGAAIEAVEMKTARDAVNEARRRGFLTGHGWVSETIASHSKTIQEMTTPAVYEVSWVIPRSKWDSKGTKKTFLFPVEKHPKQNFTFELFGASKAAKLPIADETLVEITPQGNEPVTVKGRAVLWPDLVSLSERAAFRKIEVKSQPVTLPPLYYWSERIDPAYGPCQDLAKKLVKKNVWDTMQSIVDWRMANITYAEPPPGNTLETILASKLGVCHHSSYLNASLARACGIESVVVGGFVLPEKGAFKEVEGSHGWTEFKLPGRGWIEFESQDNRSLGRFMARKHYLRYRAQDDTKPETRKYSSCQEFKVTGRRVQ